MEALGTLGGADVARVLDVYRDVLRLHQDFINRLNVYPVPDGDTGTNMALTVESVVTELDELGAGGALEMGAVCKAIAHGSLMGARGNSGVILSQLLRGSTKVLAGAEQAGPADVARALRAASEAAREAVLRPVEGTILTVAHAAAEGAERGIKAGTGLLGMLESAHEVAADALARTPEQLPVLAQAGVVDAGGTGYLLMLDSFLHVIDGRPLPEPPVLGPDGPSRVAAAYPEGAWDAESAMAADSDDSGTHLRYEVMYMLEAADETMPAFKEVWAGIGDSIVVVGGEGLWNCHIHTNDVGASIEAAIDAGRPRNIRVTDLVEQMQEERWVRDATVALGTAGQEEPSGPPPRTAVVAVANGVGVGRIFRSLGVHYLVAGGQSMNPSTAQILEVVEGTPSSEVVLLPNNDNIRPVAMQVCELASKPVRVVPTSGIVEGFAALLEYDPEAGADDNAASMAASARRVLAGEVTQAVRDATGPMGPIKAGDWMGLSRDGIEVVGESMGEAACALLAKLLGDDHELVTLIEGEGSGAADTRQVTEWLAENRADLAVEVHYGGQPLYPYLISIE
ncbi:MAG TPA: DAK2 domain-containing protein [Acidimicrobiales bacterium]|nr:DAK2 domain-containing protein [Acidimicrobiales bacterium]